MSNPSIGTIGSVAYDEPNHRSKGVITRLMRTPGQVTELLGGIADEHTQGDRLSVRTFIGHNVDPYPQASILWNGEGVSLEALVPVTGHPDVAAYAYYGACTRRQPVQIFSQEFMLLERVEQQRPSSVRTDVRTEVLNGQTTDEDVAQLLRIYGSRYSGYLTEFTPDSIHALITGSRVQVARNPRGDIVSVCVGEVTAFQIEGVSKPVMFAELSDSATDLEHQRQGFYKAAKTMLMRTLRAEDPHVVITAEGRANSRGVLRANLGLNMLRASDARGCLGYQPAHCVISSDNDADVQQIGPHGDLFVFYAPVG